MPPIWLLNMALKSYFSLLVQFFSFCNAMMVNAEKMRFNLKEKNCCKDHWDLALKIVPFKVQELRKKFRQGIFGINSHLFPFLRNGSAFISK